MDNPSKIRKYKKANGIALKFHVKNVFHRFFAMAKIEKANVKEYL